MADELGDIDAPTYMRMKRMTSPSNVLYFITPTYVYWSPETGWLGADDVEGEWFDVPVDADGKPDLTGLLQ